MSVKRRDLVRYFEQSGFYLLREGSQAFYIHERPKGNSREAAYQV